MRKNVGVIGIGEVGQAIVELAEKNFKVFEKDLKFDHIKNNKIETLHVCIPYTDNFVKNISLIGSRIKPKLIIINSTVKPGTTRKIYEKTNIKIAHCPIIGSHPYLAKHQKQFTKIIGAINNISYKLARDHWKKLGVVRVEKFLRPEESELAKILSTTYYGWNILYNKLVKRLCRKFGFDFSQVYTKFNNIYNKGYEKTKKEVVRPVLRYVPGEIGGHCVIRNAEIMSEDKEKIFDLLLELNEDFKKEK